MSGDPGGSASSPVKVPLRARLPAERVELLTPEQREDLAALEKILDARLFTWDRVDVALPATIFDEAAKPLVSLEDLLKAPEAGELERLAIAHGRLDAAQLTSIRRDATFSVPSLDYPGQTHEWKVSGLLQKGRVPSAADLRADCARAAALAVVEIPKALKGERVLSLKASARRFVEGLWDTAGLVYGGAERRPRYSSDELEALRRKELAAFMPGAAPGRDLALYDAELMKKAGPVLRERADLAARRWAARSEAVAAELDAAGPDGAARADALVAAEQQELYAALTGCAALEALHAGLGALLVARGRAVQALKAISVDEQRQVRARGEEEAARLRAARPILGLVPEWVGARVDAAEREFAASRDVRPRIAQALADIGLAPEHAAERAFAQSWPPRRAALRAERVGSREFSWTAPIWRRRNFTATFDKESERWYGVRTTTKVVSTMSAGWRLVNVLHRWRTAASSVLHGLLLENLARGPLGVRALFASRPFAPDVDCDSATGEWRPYGSRVTYLSRLRGLRAQRRAALDEHARKSSYAFFLGRTGERAVLFFSADLVLGFLAPLLVAVGQPALTAVNVALSLALAAATPFVLAPAYSLAVWILQATVYDGAGTRYGYLSLKDKGFLGHASLLFWGAIGWFAARHYGVSPLPGWAVALVVVLLSGFGPLFPWVGTFVMKTLVYGAGTAVLSVLYCGLCAILAPVVAALGALRWALRAAYDFALSLPLSRLARVPAASGRFVRRTAGPGLSSEFYFQVGAEVPLVAAWAALESRELERYRTRTAALIAEPGLAFAGLAAVVDALTGGNTGRNPDAPAYAAIAAREKEDLEALEKTVEPRSKLYGRLLNVPHQGLIKLPAPELDLLVKKTAVLSRDFYARAGWTPVEAAAFWKESLLRADDWAGLAKKTLSSVFGAGILTPLEETDATLRIRVQAPGLGEYARGLEAGILPGQLDAVSLGERPRPAAAARSEPTAQAAGVGELAGPILADEAGASAAR